MSYDWLKRMFIVPTCPACFRTEPCNATVCEHPQAPPMADRVRGMPVSEGRNTDIPQAESAPVQIEIAP